MQKAATFRQYPSIQLSTRANFVKRIQEFTKPSILWVASEKIHGSNFSVFCNGQYVKYGRRNDFITKEIPINQVKVDAYFLESFYDAKNLVLKFHNKLGDLFNDLKKNFNQNIVSYTIYGQYFGGNWISNVGKQKAVQTGIKYTPFHQFFVFDVNVKTTDQDLWIQALDLEKHIGKYINTVPIFAKGTFEEIYAINTKIDSTIPKLLNLEHVENNLIQGMVLRPNQTFFYQDSRVMLKKKNAQFLEKQVEKNDKKAGKKQQKKQKELPAQIAGPLELLTAYINKNRIQSVLSKFPNLKDRNKLKKQIYEDIIKDAEKDEFKKPAQDIFKKVNAQLDKKIMKSLNDYFASN